MNVMRPSARTSRVAGLPMSCTSAAKRSASPRVSSSAERLGQHAAQAGGLRPEQLVEASLEPDLLPEHLERVVVDVEVVVVALVDAVEGGQLGQHRVQHAEAVGQLEAGPDAVGEHEAAQLAEDALARRVGHARGGRVGEALGLGIGGEAELRREAGQAQRPQRVALVGLGAEHAQGARVEVGAAAERVDQGWRSHRRARRSAPNRSRAPSR